MLLLGFILFQLCVGGIIFIIIYFVKSQWHTGKEDVVFATQIRQGLYGDYIKILQTKFDFFNSLSSDHQKLFCRRLEKFVAYRTFYGREGFIITDEVRVLISAAAIRLTLGLDDFMLSEFPKIFVYSEAYYSKFTRTVNKGETNPHGIIVFTWPSVIEGFRTGEDKINLAYHEFAHALLLQNSINGLTDKYFHYGYQILNHALLRKKLAQKVKHANIFRDYAFTNKMEFFAVAAEYFLESPASLYDNCYELYDIMRRILRQDPLKNQYRLEFSYPRNFDEIYDTDTPEEFYYD